MNNQQFLAKQRVKYYWKALKKQTTRLDREKFREEDGLVSDSFWEYEQTPRTF